VKICKKCGGSVRGKEFNTYCEHEFDEPPEPTTVQVRAKTRYGNGPPELIWRAYIPMPDRAPLSRMHPLKEVAIDEVKARWLALKANPNALEPEAVPEGYSVGQWYGHRAGTTRFKLVKYYTSGPNRGSWTVQNGPNNRRLISHKDLAENYERCESPSEVMAKLNGRMGQRWKHTRTGAVVTLKSYCYRGAKQGWWHTNGPDVHDTQLKELYVPFEPVTYDEWLMLAASNDVSDRKRVVDKLRSMDWSSTDYMPMTAEQRADILSRNLHKGD
jgi:hypothetical protein